MNIDDISAVLANTLYIVKNRRISVRRAFASTCKLMPCSSREVHREKLYELTRLFISSFYRVKYIAEKSGRRNMSNRYLARLFLYLYFMEHDLAFPNKLKKVVRRDFPDLEKNIAEIEAWAKLSYPKWFYEKLASLLSVNEAEQLLYSMNKRVQWIRINTLKIDLDKALKLLENEVEFSVDREIPFLLKVVKSRRPLRSLKLFKEGLIIPQDKASVLVVKALTPEPDMTIYDFAAAPGIKTSLIMQLTDNKARIVAVDSSPRRLESMKKLLRKYGVEVSRVKLILADSREISLMKGADAALVDAPCSSSGAISKDPAIKIFLENDLIIHLMKRTQVDILYNALQHTDIAVYATCSLMPEEGEEVVIEVMNRGIEHKLIEPSINTSKGYSKYVVWNKVRRTFPHKDESEGFFIARFEK
ncbi:MAG: RsmB/NOP family class I SAM-dependent RNA methyltransferase [Desulfurococcaceae archaeon]